MTFFFLLLTEKDLEQILLCNFERVEVEDTLYKDWLQAKKEYIMSLEDTTQRYIGVYHNCSVLSCSHIEFTPSPQEIKQAHQ